MIEVTQAIALDGPSLGARQNAAAREARFAALVERQSRFVFRVAYALLRNPHDAEDAVQETFLKLYRADVWERLENERAFLARAAWRVAVDKLRQVRYEPLDKDIAPPGAANLEDVMAAADRHAMVHRLIDALPPELREPLVLSTVEEMNSREIAAVMDIPEGTVRTRIMRAREILKQKLAGSMGGRNDKR